MLIDTTPKFDFHQVLLKPKRSNLSSRSEVDLVKTYNFLHAKTEYKGIPIIAANMDTVATMEMAKALAEHGLATALHKHYTVDELAAFFNALAPTACVFYTMGIGEADYKKFKQVNEKLLNPLRFLCIDIANGYSLQLERFITKVRKEHPEAVIMAGNVVTADMTAQLLIAGADIIKVGIGPGSACTTRRMTGVGYPQLSAVIECVDAANGLGGHICSDGGCTVPGDVAKAFGGGAHFVMLGGMLAAHTECGGEVVDVDGVPHRKFYGMSSKTAMTKHAGGVAHYRAGEGKEVLLIDRGPVAHTVQDILGGLRSTCTYVGARRLKDLPKCTTFIMAGMQTNDVFGRP